MPTATWMGTDLVPDLAKLQAQINTLSNSPLQFVTPNVITVAQLLATYPAGAAYSGFYCRVSDLYNNGVSGAGLDEIIRCRYDKTNNLHRWVPQRDNAFVVDVPSPTGTVTITPLVTPPTLRITGNLLSNINIAMSTTNAYVGERRKIILSGTLGTLVTATITGIITGSGLLTAGSMKEVEYGASGWFTTS